ncbi:hypothetical protein [Halorubrum halodurans]|uniref:Uncharacterized protein n=1 Tax=Halorubrum halodurans TaxID=1383851 RepID=A0A256IGP1_9EURY|nr:hypothetical protein [Halorubrum halodurans]OYR55714.1 hypothetical protein DJ70_11440 [Halorubrum halodurans]
MGRNRLRSDLASERPSRLDWLAVAGLIGVGTVSIAALDAPLAGILALVAALGFGTLLAVSEAGLLAGDDSETDGE